MQNTGMAMPNCQTVLLCVLKKLKKTVPLDDPDILQFPESNSFEVVLENESKSMEITGYCMNYLNRTKKY